MKNAIFYFYMDKTVCAELKVKQREREKGERGRERDDDYVINVEAP